MSHAIILFDGICQFCNNAVLFVLQRDSSDRFRFCSLQSNAGQKLLDRYGLPSDIQSLVLIDAQNVYLQSDAVLQICKGLGRGWKTLYIFKVIPKPLRDLVYRTIATYRYRWFGKQEKCMIPTPEIRAKFWSDE